MLKEHRLEIVLAAAIVVMGAFYARAVYIPTWADRHVEVTSEKLNLEFGDPSRWFSAWSIGDGLNRPGFCDCCGYWLTASRAVGF